MIKGSTCQQITRFLKTLLLNSRDRSQRGIGAHTQHNRHTRNAHTHARTRHTRRARACWTPADRRHSKHIMMGERVVWLDMNACGRVFSVVGRRSGWFCCCTCFCVSLYIYIFYTTLPSILHFQIGIDWGQMFPKKTKKNMCFFFFGIFLFLFMQEKKYCDDYLGPKQLLICYPVIERPA